MGKQVRIKGYQSVFGSQIFIDGNRFLPENNNFLDNFKIPSFLNVSNQICFRGYISYNLIHLLGPGYYLPDEIESKEINKWGNHNPLIYVEFQVSSILYFEVKSYFFNTLKHFDIALDIFYAKVQIIKKNKTNSRYGKHVEININHGCGVFSKPLELKEHQIRIRKEFPEFQLIESVVRLDFSESFEDAYFYNNLNEHNPDRLICFLKSTVESDVSFKESPNLKNILKLISDIKLIPYFVKVYLTNKDEIINKISIKNLTNPKNLYINGIVMLIRGDKTYDKEINEYTYSYSVAGESEIINLLYKM